MMSCISSSEVGTSSRKLEAFAKVCFPEVTSGFLELGGSIAGIVCALGGVIDEKLILGGIRRE
jgi:hypothetical protein